MLPYKFWLVFMGWSKKNWNKNWELVDPKKTEFFKFANFQFSNNANLKTLSAWMWLNLCIWLSGCPIKSHLGAKSAKNGFSDSPYSTNKKLLIGRDIFCNHDILKWLCPFVYSSNNFSEEFRTLWTKELLSLSYNRAEVIIVKSNLYIYWHACLPFLLLLLIKGTRILGWPTSTIMMPASISLDWHDKFFCQLFRPFTIDVLWCQPIKLIQVVSTSEFHEYWWKDVDFIFFVPSI